MAKNIVLDSNNPTYNKAEHPEDIGQQVSISLADGFSRGSVSNLEAGDNI